MSGSIIHVTLDDERAILPHKAHQTDAGYDVSIIDVVKDYGNGVVLYDTGLIIEPHTEDIYLELVARSSLAKLARRVCWPIAWESLIMDTGDAL